MVLAMPATNSAKEARRGTQRSRNNGFRASLVEGRSPKQARSVATRQRLLDAAIGCLVEDGYTNLTLTKVAARADVSRGAAQAHFPSKLALVVAASDWLTQQSIAEAFEHLGPDASDLERLESTLDTFYDEFTGRRFIGALELASAAREHPELRELLADEEREVARTLRRNADLFGASIVAHPDFDARLAIVMASIRGLGVLQRLGYSSQAVGRQWRLMRPQLLGLFDPALASEAAPVANGARK